MPEGEHIPPRRHLFQIVAGGHDASIDDLLSDRSYYGLSPAATFAYGGLDDDELLQKDLTALGATLDRVLAFDVLADQLVRRLAGRRVCRDCGLTQIDAPVGGGCRECDGALQQRVDDREETSISTAWASTSSRRNRCWSGTRSVLC